MFGGKYSVVDSALTCICQHSYKIVYERSWLARSHLCMVGSSNKGSMIV